MKLFLVFGLIWGATASASIHGLVPVFTAQEKEEHLSKVDEFTQVASKCLETYLYEHQTFFNRVGISRFVGDQMAIPGHRGKRFADKDVWNWGKNGSVPKVLEKWGVFRYWERRLGKKISRADRQKFKNTSCIGMALSCMKQAFNKTGQSHLLSKVLAYYRKPFDKDQKAKFGPNGGIPLMLGLRALGWKSVYWNPKPSKNSSWDRAERGKAGGFKGYHKTNYDKATRRSNPAYSYANIPVDDNTTLVDTGTAIPEKFHNVPFYIGMAHQGYHVFPGYNNENGTSTVIEAHSTRALNDYQQIEISPFNPWQNGGGPRGDYRSGLIVVPPGYDF